MIISHSNWMLHRHDVDHLSVPEHANPERSWTTSWTLSCINCISLFVSIEEIRDDWKLWFSPPEGGESILIHRNIYNFPPCGRQMGIYRDFPPGRARRREHLYQLRMPSRNPPKVPTLTFFGHFGSPIVSKVTHEILRNAMDHLDSVWLYFADWRQF